MTDSFPEAHPESVLLLTLDSCRYDTASETPTPNISTVGPLHRAMAPGHFTFSSHASMWVGTTPGIAQSHQPVLNPKAGRLFRLANVRAAEQPGDVFVLKGRSVLEGFRRRGYSVLGTGSVACSTRRPKLGPGWSRTLTTSTTFAVRGLFLPSSHGYVPA